VLFAHTLQLGLHSPFLGQQPCPLNENKLMGISGVFMNNTWSHDLGFYWSWSEAQKGANDMGQIKALVGGLPVTILPLVRIPCFHNRNLAKLRVTRDSNISDCLRSKEHDFFSVSIGISLLLIQQLHSAVVYDVGIVLAHVERCNDISL